MSNTIKILNGIEYLFPNIPYLPQLKRTLTVFPEAEDHLSRAFSLGQLKSKLWLIEKLPNNLGNVFICAGWVGTLANIMFEKCPTKFKSIRSFDIDPVCELVADELNRKYLADSWKFKAATLDIFEMTYPTSFNATKSDGSVVTLKETPDTIINTSCEHLDNFDRWYSRIPYGKLVILQSNNYFDVAEHVNCVKSVDELEASAPMTRVIYKGELDLEKYKRFMLIGIK